MAITSITDHAARSIKRLVSQFQESPRFKGLLTVLSNEAQAIEDAFQDLLAQFRDVTVANDDALDKLGKLVGAPDRGGMNNTLYRARVIAQIFINRSSGNNVAIYGIAKHIVTAWDVTGQPRIKDTPPAEFVIGPDEDNKVVNDDDEARDLVGILNGNRDNDGARAVGVRAIVHSRPDTVASNQFFRFAGGAGPAAGFGVGHLRGAYDKK